MFDKWRGKRLLRRANKHIDKQLEGLFWEDNVFRYPKEIKERIDSRKRCLVNTSNLLFYIFHNYDQIKDHTVKNFALLD